MRSESEVRDRVRLVDQKLRVVVSRMYREGIGSVDQISELSLKASVLDAATKELDWVLGDDGESLEGGQRNGPGDTERQEGTGK